MNVQVKDDIKKQFIRACLMIDGENPCSCGIDGDYVSCSSIGLITMIQRLVNGETCVLPYQIKDSFLWIVLTPDYRLLLKHAEEVKHFIAPFYAEQMNYGVQLFQPEKGLIGSAGKELFPDGYVCFKSPASLFDRVLEALMLWSHLDYQRPEIYVEDQQINAYVLRGRFQQALSLQCFDDAKNALDLLRQGHYISDENCLFLQVQYLSAQARWDEIWNSRDFNDIASLEPLPRAVRVALITAFYKSIIVKVEETGYVKDTLEVFDKYRYKLGNLLGYTAGLEGDLFLRMLAYEATVKNNAKRLDKLFDEAIEETTKEIIRQLKLLVSNVNTPEEVGSSLEKAIKCFNERNYDDAYLYALDAEPIIDSVKLLLGIATITEDKEFCETALNMYNKLEEVDRNSILQDPNAKGWAIFVVGFRLSSREIDNVDVSPKTWVEWYKSVYQDSYTKEFLLTSLEKILEESSLHEWTHTMISELDDILLGFITNHSITNTQSYLLKISLPNFAAYVLRDAKFPNHYALNLYESLEFLLRNYCNRNEVVAGFLLKLNEGLLACDIEYCRKQWTGVEEWFRFSPSMKFSFYVLETLTLFHEYGLEYSKMIDLWTQWVGSLQGVFSSESKFLITNWVRVGKLIHADANLISNLETLLFEPIGQDNIAHLDEMIITIFSCREKAAKRAAEQITQRNPKLHIRICTDDKLTEQAQTYAKNSDVVIVVTACISHALTYGITPYLQKSPIYPRSSGEIGIIESFEEYARKRISVM